MNKMTFIGWIGLTALACQSNTEGYQIKGNIEGAGNGIAIMTLPVGREEPTTGDTVKMENGVFTFTGKLEAPSWVSIQVCPDKEKPASCGFIGENNTITLAGKRTERHSTAGRPYPAGGAGRTETAAATHKGTVIDDRKHFTPQHNGTAL